MAGDISQEVQLKALVVGCAQEVIDLGHEAEDTIEALWRCHRRYPLQGSDETFRANALQISESLARKVQQRLNQYYEKRRDLMSPQSACDVLKAQSEAVFFALRETESSGIAAAFSQVTSAVEMLCVISNALFEVKRPPLPCGHARPPDLGYCRECQEIEMEQNRAQLGLSTTKQDGGG